MRLFLLLFVTSVALGQECLPLDKYSTEAVPPVVLQKSQTIVQVSWNELWPSLDWLGCVSKLEIVVNDEVRAAIEDLSVKDTEIEVPSCQDLAVTIKCTLTDGNEVSSSQTNTILFLPPSPTFDSFENSIVEGALVTPNSFKVSLPTLDSLISEPECRKVVGTTLVTRSKGEKDWNVVEELGVLGEATEAVIEFGATDCNVLEIGLELEPHDVYDTIVMPISQVDFASLFNQILESLKTEYSTQDDPDLESPINVQATSVSNSDIELQVEVAEPKSCFSGIFIEGQNGLWKTNRILSTSETHTTFEKLESCQEHDFFLSSYEPQLLETEWVMRTSPAVKFSASTTLDSTNQFEIDSLSVDTELNKIVLSYSKQEYGCVDTTKTFSFALCRSKEDDACLDVPNVSTDDKNVYIEFDNLDACSRYLVSEVQANSISLTYNGFFFDLQLKGSRSVIGDVHQEDFIELDASSSNPNIFWKRVQTGRSIAQTTSTLSFTNLTQTSVRLEWSVDPCANAYILADEVQTDGSNVLFGTKYLETRKPNDLAGFRILYRPEVESGSGMVEGSGIAETDGSGDNEELLDDEGAEILEIFEF